MQITLTLDDDLAAALEEEVERSGRPFKDAVSSLLRRGLGATHRSRPARPFEVRAYHLGMPPADLDLDNIGELLERIEGPMHR